MGMFEDVRGIALGASNANDMFERYRVLSASTFQPDPLRSVETQHTRCVSWMDLDRVEQRYMLVSSLDRHVQIYDTYFTTEDLQNNLVFASSEQRKSHVPIAVAFPNSFSSGISSCAWLPFDTGIFLTSLFDGNVLVFDTNRLECVMKFSLNNNSSNSKNSGASSSKRTHAYHVSLSHHSAARPLAAISVAGTEPSVRICDLNSGAVTHTLTGHTDDVYITQWHPGREYVLVSSGQDGTVRWWDIRRAGYIHAFDAEDTVATGELVSSAAPPTKRPRLINYRAPRAHEGRVNALKFTPDGRYLLTSGSDKHVRLWSTSNFKNQLVSYPGIQNDTKQVVEIAMNPEGTVFFHPNSDRRKRIVAYGVRSGTRVYTQGLVGHYGTPTCCVYHPLFDSLWSASTSDEILVWNSPFFKTGSVCDAPVPPAPSASSSFVGPSVVPAVAAEQDAWSDDET
eukprot:ANDGO_05673.mRNA.1 DNA excision repair protein ckn1